MINSLRANSGDQAFQMSEGYILERRFKNVFETANDAILLLEEMIIVDCNKKAIEMLGVEREDMIGKTPFDFSSEFQPDGITSEKKGLEFADKIIKEGHFIFEWMGKRGNGELFLTEVSVSSFLHLNKSYITAFARDITILHKDQNELLDYRLNLEEIIKEQTNQLKEKIIELHVANKELDSANEELVLINEELSTTNEELDRVNNSLKQEIEDHSKTQVDKAFIEEKLKQFIIQSSSGFIIINSEGIIEEWNESMFRYTGISQTEALDQTMWNITAEMAVDSDINGYLRENFRQNTSDFLLKVEAGNLSPLSFETQIKHKDSCLRFIYITLFPIIVQNGNYAGCIIDDITRKKANEAELEKYRENLEILLAQKSEHLVQLSDRFNEVYTNSSDAITFIDIIDGGKNFKVFDMNPTAQNLFKITPEMIARGVFARDFVHESNFEIFINQLLPTLISGQSVSYIDEKDVGDGYWNSTIFPIENESGLVNRLASFSKNVTAEYEKEKLSLILNAAIDSWPYGIWVSDIQDRCIMQNPNGKKIWGDMIGKKFDELDLPDDLKQSSIEKHFRAIQGESSSTEYEIKTPDGIRYVLLNLHPIKQNNKITGFLGIGIDITERKQNEEKIRASEEKYRLLAENIEDVILKFDLNTRRFNYVSPSVFKLRGYTPEEAMTQSLEEVIMPGFLQKEEKALEERISRFNEGDLSARSTKYEIQIRHKSGQAIWVEMASTLLTDQKGNLSEMLAISRDITERKNAENKFKQLADLHQTILDTVYVGLAFVKDRETQWTNKNYYTLFGYDYSDLIEAETSLTYKNENEYKRIGDEGYSVLSKGEIYSTEIQLKRKDGSVFWCNLVGKAIDSKDNSKGSIWLFQDITEHKNAELALQKSEAILNATMESMNDGILVVLSDNKISHVNTRFRQIFSISDDILSEKENEPVLNHVTKQLSNPEEFRREVLEIYQTNSQTEDILHLIDGRIIEMLSFPLMKESPEKGRVWLFRDITERKKAEDALLKSQKLLRDSQRIAHIGCWEYNLKSNRLEWNDEASEIYGYKDQKNQPTLETYTQLIHPDDRPFVALQNEKSIRENEFEDYECRIVRPDGTIRTIFVTGAVNLDENGKAYRAFGIVQDITDRKLSEEKLRESEERYRKITKLSGYIVYDYKSETNNVIWAGAIEEVTGYTDEEFQNTSFSKIYDYLHPDDRERIKTKFLESITQNKTFREQYRYLTKNKGYIWIDVHSFVFSNKESKAYRWLGIIKDISEQRKAQEIIIESEKKLRTIFDNSKDGIALLDKELRITDLNNAILSKSNIAKEAIIDKKVIDFVNEEDLEEINKWFDQITNKKKIQNIETNLKTDSNSTWPVEISAAPIILNEEQAFILIVRDISERKQLEKEFLNIVIETEEKERLNFSQELHDGLGPLLSAAKMYVEWLEKPNANIEKSEIISDIKNLLIESGNTVREISFKLSPHILQNYGLIEALKAYAQKINESSKIKIDIIANEFQKMRETLEIIIYRVLCECINNTIKHSKAQNISIVFESDEKYLKIKYNDNGQGFDVNTILTGRKGIGILNMQSRLKSINGSFTIQSSQSSGTNILIKIKK